jgi:two-component system, NarL family, invasion response regulator UvrY
MRVLLIDSHQLVRDVLAQALAAQPDLEIVGQGATGQEALDLTRQLAPDAVLIAVRLPGISGVDATRAILAEYPGLCVIGMTLVDNPAEAEAIRAAGAHACISKSGPLEGIFGALRACPGVPRVLNAGPC